MPVVRRASEAYPPPVQPPSPPRTRSRRPSMDSHRLRIALLAGAACAAAVLASTFAGLSARAACPPGVLFGTPVSDAVLGRPNRVVLADLDGDGALDAVCPLPDNLSWGYDNRIAVLLGDGTGGFGPAAYYTAGSRPIAVCAADLDGDGKLDLAVSNWNSNSVSLLRGAGDGTFTPLAAVSCGVRPYELLATDLNEDGIADLVVASNGQSAIHVLLGLGNAAFAAPVPYYLPDAGLALAAGDLDSDSHVDIVATANQSGCVVFRGNGNGTLGNGTGLATGQIAYTLALGLLDGDATLDLAVGNSGSSGVAVLMGSGAGGFGAPAFHPVDACGGIAIADFDRDGIRDFAVTSATGNSLKVFRGGSSAGVPTGTFSLLTSIPAGVFPVGLAAGSLGGDSLPDLVIAGYNSATVITLPSECPPPAATGERPRLVSVRDVPADQGGRVFLRWTRSSLDSAGVAAITAYRIWRRLPPEAASLSARRAAHEAGLAPAERRVIAREAGPAAAGIDYWEWIGEIPAQQLAGYGYAAPTLQDSTAAGNPYTAFFVTALTGDHAVFHESNVDSGYSVDNVPPPAPATFTGTHSAAGVVLRWSPSGAPDLAGYRLYRGATAGFVPGPSNFLASLPDTGYLDAGSLGGCYKLSAVDVHGNEGGHSLVALADVTGVPGGPAASLWLAPPAPNPSRLGARLRFALPREGAVRLALHDLQGRLVRELSRGRLPAGEHAVSWDGRERSGQIVRSGLYVVSLEAEGRVVRTRLVVAR